MMKIEGKEDEPPKPVRTKLLSEDQLYFPARFINSDVLAQVIGDVLNTGIGGVMEDRRLVMEAFSWNSAPLPRVWSLLDNNGVVTPEVYELCQWWNDNWDLCPTEDTFEDNEECEGFLEDELDWS